MALTQIKSSNITDGTIVNADVSVSAAIASTKLSGVESGLTSVQVFTASGTWTRPTGITKVVMEVQGGGAGGGRNTSGSACIGGSGGGYAKKLLDVSSISTSTITVGAAGVGATGTAAAGTDGGDSIWADGTNTITGVKGVGGNTTQTYTVGGLATGGDINIQGGKGRKGHSGGGAGGSSQLGRLGPSSDGGGSPATNPDASGYGSGGGGVQDATRAGNGTQGIVMVTEYK